MDEELCPFCQTPERVTTHEETHEMHGALFSYTRYENEGCENVNCPDEVPECPDCGFEALTPKGGDYYDCHQCREWFRYASGKLLRSNQPPIPYEASKAFFRGLGRLKEAV